MSGKLSTGDKVVAARDLGGWGSPRVKAGTVGVVEQAVGFCTPLRVLFGELCYAMNVADTDVRRLGDLRAADPGGSFKVGARVVAVKDFGGWSRVSVKAGTVGVVKRAGGSFTTPSVLFDGVCYAVDVSADEVHLAF